MLLKINQLYFSHSPEKRLFHNFNLKVEAGKIIALAGESGCGKSTLINLIYGLLDWEKGEIIFDGKPVFGPKKNIVPGENEMKLVAQNYDLMPYATVSENVGKFISNINLNEKKAKINRLTLFFDHEYRDYLWEPDEVRENILSSGAIWDDDPEWLVGKIQDQNLLDKIFKDCKERQS